MNILYKILGHKITINSPRGIAGDNPCTRKGCGYTTKGVEWNEPPSPKMYVCETKEEAEKHARERLEPLIDKIKEQS